MSKLKDESDRYKSGRSHDSSEIIIEDNFYLNDLAPEVWKFNQSANSLTTDFVKMVGESLYKSVKRRLGFYFFNKFL